VEKVQRAKAKVGHGGAMRSGMVRIMGGRIRYVVRGVGNPALAGSYVNFFSSYVKIFTMKNSVITGVNLNF